MQSLSRRGSMEQVDTIDVTGLERLESNDLISSALDKRKPAILRGLIIGTCRQVWTPDYLQDIYPDKKVTVHVSENAEMDFIKKNFQYKTLNFGDFIHRCFEDSHSDYFISAKEKYYLRALGEDVRKEPANFSATFPNLAADFNLPDNLVPQDRLFSTVFRAASKGMRLWTHYDTMDNILVEVIGRKRVILFSPFDAQYLYLIGDKSPIIQPEISDQPDYPDFKHATPLEAVLNPGDCLFIPALWFHNVLALDPSVAVNVFWRHLCDGLYDQKDVYGNREPLPVQRACQGLDTAARLISDSGLPLEFRHVYGLAMIKRLTQRLGLDL